MSNNANAQNEESEDSQPASPTLLVQPTGPRTNQNSTTSRATGTRERPRGRVRGRRRSSNNHHHHHHHRSGSGRHRHSQRSNARRNTSGSPNNPYIVVVVPPINDSSSNSNNTSERRTDNNNNNNNNNSNNNNSNNNNGDVEAGNCCKCLDNGTVHMVFNLIYLTCCEFIPWVLGTIFIYYAYIQWGLTIAASVFVVLMGIHGIIRWVKTRTNYNKKGCLEKPETPRVVRRAPEAAEVAVNIEHDSHDESGSTSDSSSDISTSGSESNNEEYIDEEPPSYEEIAQVTEDTQKHLICHLTPTRARVNLESPATPSKPENALQDEIKNVDNNLLTVPKVYFGRSGTPATTDDDDDDDFVFLPTYYDALRRESLAKTEAEESTDEEFKEKLEKIKEIQNNEDNLKK